MLWLTAGALILALAMIAGLLAYVGARGAATFWPGPILEIAKSDGTRLLGEIQGEDRFVPAGSATLVMVRAVKSIITSG